MTYKLKEGIRNLWVWDNDFCLIQFADGSWCLEQGDEQVSATSATYLPGESVFLTLEGGGTATINLKQPSGNSYK